MNKIEALIMSIFGGVLTIAIVSVIISKKSQTPQVIQAGATALASVVSAAVNPLSNPASGGIPELNSFTHPSVSVSP